MSIQSMKIGCFSLCCCVLVLGGNGVTGTAYAMMQEMSVADSLSVAERVFKNECRNEQACLIEWNVGEEFLSLGLGHFIWYPEGVPAVLGESFRSYLQYARDAGDILPDWLDKTPLPACPWSSRQQFANSKESAFYQDLLDFLRRTKQRQAEYIVARARNALQEVVDAAPEAERSRIARDIVRLSSEGQGLYALIDYVNFKGAGLLQTENYRGQGWGLLQVLRNMHETLSPQETLEEFIRSAKEVLQRRVINSPLERNEQQWLSGWLRRLDTYEAIK